jgi:hypothetical protein
MIWFPRNPEFSLALCNPNMSEEEAQKRLDKANAWLARNSELKGTYAYTYWVFETVTANTRLAQIRGIVPLA